MHEKLAPSQKPVFICLLVHPQIDTVIIINDNIFKKTFFVFFSIALGKIGKRYGANDKRQDNLGLFG